MVQAVHLDYIGLESWLVAFDGSSTSGAAGACSNLQSRRRSVALWSLASARFGIPKRITTDQGTAFTSAKVKAFTAKYGIQLLPSSPYYHQANGQAKATNKVLISIIKKALEDNPRGWHDTLKEALWACKNAKSSVISSTPYRLTYRHDAVLQLEITVPSLSILKVNGLSMEEHE
ncbi:uncharacterized protein LOC127260337 [Andrographis paniculata]|uniref:uncharacterized protein LOC127260337 n=1 Tax=Andrographis paniculata TaxID=175694 RepID=UPI0021E761E5|nr:uncharacterized protein LOC127260337 [Andrographis paniculata]